MCKAAYCLVNWYAFFSNHVCFCVFIYYYYFYELGLFLMLGLIVLDYKVSIFEETDLSRYEELDAIWGFRVLIVIWCFLWKGRDFADLFNF